MRRLLLLPLFVAACSSAPLPPDQLFQTTVIPPKHAGDGYSLVRMAGYDPNAMRPWSQWQLSGIAISDDYLFIASEANGIYRMPKYGGTVEAVETGRNVRTNWVLVSGTRVYWDHETNGIAPLPYNRIESRDVAGGPIATLEDRSFVPLDTSNGTVERQVDDKYLYYVAGEGNSAPPATSLQRLPLGGGMPVPLKPAPDAPVTAQTFGVDFLANGGDVFVVDGNELQIFAGGSTTATKLADLPPMPNAGNLLLEAADVNSVYLMGDSAIFTVSRRNGDVKSIYTLPDKDSGFFSGLIVDANSVYFVTARKAGLAVVSMPKAGGPTTQLSRSSLQLNGGVDAMVQDDKNLFLLHDFAEVVMVPKTPTGKFE